MSIIQIILIGAAVAIVGIAIGVVYNKLVIKDYPERDKKIGYVGSVIVFLLISLALFGVLFGRTVANQVIKDLTAKVEQQINDKHSQTSFVKDGIDLKGIEADASRVSVAVGALKVVLPSSADLGLPRLVYNTVIGFVTDQMQKSLTTPKNAEKFIKDYAQENILTVSSLTAGLRQKGINIVNITTVVLVVIFVILLGIYLLSTSSKVAKQRRKNAAKT